VSDEVRLPEGRSGISAWRSPDVGPSHIGGALRLVPDQLAWLDANVADLVSALD
jgi:hypothetical protein